MYAANRAIPAAVKAATHTHRDRRAERGVTAPARPVRSGSGAAAAPATPCAGPAMGQPAAPGLTALMMSTTKTSVSVPLMPACDWPALP